MRNIRPLSFCNLGVIDDSTSCVEDLLFQSQAHEVSRLPTGLSENDLALSCPEWADFEMETGFWGQLEKICEAENFSYSAFVERAQHRYPELSIGTAVRFDIISYFRRRSGWVSGMHEIPIRSLHEALPPRPKPTGIA